MTLDLLNYKKDLFTQFGEDGIITELFRRIPVDNKLFCEFGAADGVSCSNTRNLYRQGWGGVLIESNAALCRKLTELYRYDPSIRCLCVQVEAEGNTLRKIFSKAGMGDQLEKIAFLSIDIDGKDYEIFETLDFSPPVICIEVNPGFSPQEPQPIEKTLAQKIGQPLDVFHRLAKVKGYGLVCYTTNAFFVRGDLIKKYGLPELSSLEAYQNLIRTWPDAIREWMFLNNLGFTYSFAMPYVYKNPYLEQSALGISDSRAEELLKTKGKYMYKEQAEKDKKNLQELRYELALAKDLRRYALGQLLRALKRKCQVKLSTILSSSNQKDLTKK